MSDRDVLYDLLDGLLPEREIVRSDIAGAMVEAIEAAGWRPPVREISDPDELDKVPYNSIVVAQSAGGVPWHAAWWTNTIPTWFSVMTVESWSSAELLAVVGSVTLVHAPSEEAESPKD